LASDDDFVVRASYDRLVQIGPRRADTARLSEVLAAQPVLTTKTIEVSARTADKARRSYPVRAARQAEVSIRSATVDLRRPTTVPAGSAADVLTVHVVEVVELEPPAADEAGHWVLLTRVPAPDAQSCLRVVRWYQACWVIEEYFKALKTGCAFLQSQLQSASVLLRQLATDAQVACDVLHLRDVVRVADDRPVHHTLTPLQLIVLSQIYSRITPDSSLHEAWLAIAELGGHFKRKGPPGWLVLCRLGGSSLWRGRVLVHGASPGEEGPVSGVIGFGVEDDHGVVAVEVEVRLGPFPVADTLRGRIDGDGRRPGSGHAPFPEEGHGEAVAKEAASLLGAAGAVFEVFFEDRERLASVVSAPDDAREEVEDAAVALDGVVCSHVSLLLRSAQGSSRRW
ncbi:MAG: hypothetical protein KC492_15155, partial [Myxococcales bacterium]|nr:hypothetical protein [Myxococcales bacterium]